MAPLGLVRDLALERRRPTLVGYIFERFLAANDNVRGGLGGLLDAIGVVNGEFLDLWTISAMNAAAC